MRGSAHAWFSVSQADEVEVVRSLLELRADVDAVTSDGKKPVDWSKTLQWVAAVVMQRVRAVVSVMFVLWWQPSCCRVGQRALVECSCTCAAEDVAWSPEVRRLIQPSPSGGASSGGP